jgi:hypothetical protein
MKTNASPSPRSSLLQQALREPLLHFLLLGAVVFGIDHTLALNRGDSQTITVEPAVRAEAHSIFVAGRKREPTAQEMQTLLDRWIDNEVLYREGLALGLDRGDASIRERVIFKALSVAQAGISLPPIDEAGLKTWFEARRERYDTPDRFDFYEAVPHGAPSAESLKVFTAALNGQAQSEIDSSLRVFKDRPRDNLVQSYGPEFADRLARLTPGHWELLPSNEGPRLVRLEALKPGAQADYAAIRETVYQNWKDDTLAQRTTQAIREMGRKYTVRNGGAAQ